MAAQRVRQQRTEHRVLAEVGNRREHVDAWTQQTGLHVLHDLIDSREHAQPLVEAGGGIRRHEEDERRPQRHEHPARNRKAPRTVAHDCHLSRSLPQPPPLATVVRSLAVSSPHAPRRLPPRARAKHPSRRVRRVGHRPAARARAKHPPPPTRTQPAATFPAPSLRRAALGLSRTPPLSWPPPSVAQTRCARRAQTYPRLLPEAPTPRRNRPL